VISHVLPQHAPGVGAQSTKRDPFLAAVGNECRWRAAWWDGAPQVHTVRPSPTRGLH
jgi:hypothetical protein